jgi:hypothetical protein
MNYSEAKIKAENCYKTIMDFAVSDEKGVKRARIIAVQHADGSYLEFHGAAYEKLDCDWLAVFTEHHGYFVYHWGDVKWVRELSHRDLYIYDDWGGE